MTGDGPQTVRRHEPERIHEHASGTTGSGQGAER